MTQYDKERAVELWQSATPPETKSPHVPYTIEPLPQSEALAHLERYLESVRRSTRAIDDLTTPLSKAVAKNCLTALQRLAMLPVDGDRAFDTLRDELIELTRSLVRKLASRLGLDRGKLLAGDLDEWACALDGQPGGRFGALAPGLAAFAESIMVPSSAPTNTPIVAPVPAHADGCFDPYTLWINGERRQLEPKPFAMISYMWTRESALVHNVIGEIWTEDAPGDNSFHNAKRKVNEALDELQSARKLIKRGDFLLFGEHTKKVTKFDSNPVTKL